eukprot:GHVU01145277.1.p1 GENE.GHVU01145277.1~~GHVU01145277.1.p1  ORF type:complete len:116 (-),score=19.99 GHVU01145277.1:606-953(-)
MAAMVPPPPPSSGSTAGIGIIFPPEGMRERIDKTASFVARNGPEFENRLLTEQSQKGGQKFTFLMRSNPYRKYYEMKVRDFQTGESTVPDTAVPRCGSRAFIPKLRIAAELRCCL